ncbi:MAG: glycerate kinase, partial [Gemmatimonadetes bacterium]|nr:glycerate kinase [Gemmatimonadota bacterium]
VGADLPPVEVLCDVDNPLLGEKGAAHIFGPQKGAGPEMVEALDAGLSQLADRVEVQLGVDVRHIPGAGAAGGLGAAAVAFMNATLVSGVDAVMRATRLEESIEAADWVITGEGRFDSQSLHGKVVSGIARLAAEHGTRVGVLAGSVLVSKEEAALNGVHDFEGASPEGMPIETAMARGGELLKEAAGRLASRELGSHT